MWMVQQKRASDGEYLRSHLVKFPRISVNWANVKGFSFGTNDCVDKNLLSMTNLYTKHLIYCRKKTQFWVLETDFFFLSAFDTFHVFCSELCYQIFNRIQLKTVGTTKYVWKTLANVFVWWFVCSHSPCADARQFLTNPFGKHQICWRMFVRCSFGICVHGFTLRNYMIVLCYSVTLHVCTPLLELP